jgi:hypothetical protein
MIPSYPKIFAIGTKYINNIFDDLVNITEKVDGSQFGFGKIDGEVYLRSKGAQLFFDIKEQMFAEAINYIDSIQNKLPNNMIFYSEYLKKPKHNTLKYERIPKNHLILFGVMNLDQTFNKDLKYYADILDIETVPVLYTGLMSDFSERVDEFLNTDSILGGSKIEGVVVKNYYQSFLLGGQPIPIMCGKFVSEKFKETNNKRWAEEEKGKSKLETFMRSFQTESRWEKAYQHLRDSNLLEFTPRDIGSLIKEAQRDIIDEEKENIRDFLWNEFKGQILRTAISGLPEWYKRKLLES